MKKAKKRVLGLLGLSLVVAMTTIAAFLPTQGAMAASTLTDTIQVRVIGSTPFAEFTVPPEDIEVTDPDQSVEYIYENVTSLRIEVTYTDDDGITTHHLTKEYEDLDYIPGSGVLPLEIAPGAYGKYIAYLYGVGHEGVETLFDVVAIKYVPTPEDPDIVVPDTGSFFKNLNISNEDYIITGLIIFFVFSIIGFGIVARKKR